MKRVLRKLKTLLITLRSPRNISFEGSYFFLSNIETDISKNAQINIDLGLNAKIYNTLIYVRGKNCKIRISDHSRVENSIFWLEDDNNYLEIGKNSTFEGVKFYITELNSEIRIGESCMFSNEIELRTGDSHTIYDKNNHQRINSARDIFIGDKVWVAAHTKILKGSKIPNNVILGLGSLVTASSKFVSDSIYAGSPISLIRQNVGWKRER
jgi:acetyltransferase-like isoleucine patch superfamily enzyme